MSAAGSSNQEMCTICFELVVMESSERGSARLRCGHVFHLDCITSNFNTSGTMMCPNCRNIEYSQWRIAERTNIRPIAAAAAAQQPQTLYQRVEQLHMQNTIPGYQIPSIIRRRSRPTIDFERVDLTQPLIARHGEAPTSTPALLNQNPPPVGQNSQRIGSRTAGELEFYDIFPNRSVRARLPSPALGYIRRSSEGSVVRGPQPEGPQNPPGA